MYQADPFIIELSLVLHIGFNLGGRGSEVYGDNYLYLPPDGIIHEVLPTPTH